MRMEGEIDKAKFNEKKEHIEKEKERLNNMLLSYHIEEDLSEEEMNEKLTILKYGLEQDFNFSTHNIPDEVIDAFVDQVIVYKDCFVWKLKLFDDTIQLTVNGRKNNATVSLVESPHVSDGSTGSNRRKIITAVRG